MDFQVLMVVLIGLFVKHFLMDFIWQYPWHYKNKGTYGHPGGIVHSLEHLLGTAIVLGVVSQSYGNLWSAEKIAWICLMDGVIHYHVDWAKVKLNKHYEWGATTHEEFWVLLGLDQLLHMLTYAAILILLFG